MNPRSRCHYALTTLLLASIWASPTHAQDVGFSLHVGSLGIGADLAVAVNDNLSLRAGGNVFPFDINITESDIRYTLDLRSPSFLTVIDLSPGGAFRVSGGLLIATRDFTIDAELAEPVDIGGTLYQPSDIGSLTGVLDTRDVAPYVGIGFGSPRGGGVRLFLDLGVALHGSPEVSAVASGPIASDPQFQQDLQQEVDDLQDSLSSFRVYPVLSIGLMIGVGPVYGS